MRDKTDKIYFRRVGDFWRGGLRYCGGAGSKCSFPITGDVKFISVVGLSMGSGFQVRT